MRSRLTGALTLAAAVAITYWNAFPGAFHYDDYPLLLESDRVTGDGFSPILFLQQYGGRPLTLLSFLLNYRVFGAEASAFLAVNLVLHWAVSVLVMVLVLRFTQDRPLSILAALLFAVHPLQAQSVNYVWARSVILMSFFLMLAVLYCHRSRVSALLFQCALFSRADALIGALALGHLNRGNWKWLVPVCLANVLMLGYGFAVHQPEQMAFNHPDPLGYWAKAGPAFLEYVRKMAAPLDLAIYYPEELIPVPFLLVGWLVLGGVAASAWRGKKREPIPSSAAVWILLFLAPSLLVPNTILIADSRAYLSLAGFAVLAVWILLRIQRSCGGVPGTAGTWLRALSLLLIVAGLVLAAVQTNKRNTVWRDDVAVWREAVEHNSPDNRALYNYAVSLARTGEVEKAGRVFAEAIELNPSDDMSYAGLGYCAEMERRWDDALEAYMRAVEIDSGNSYAAEGIGRIRRQLVSEVGEQ